ncbi:MAG: hypothetical protein LUC86_08180 [Prevotellaceae bacterium]|nr:hypothetical protein [Prevotellaceae bacterium]
MKKVIVTYCILFTCVAAFASNPYKVLTGKENLKSISKESVPILLVIDWSETKYDGDKEVTEEWGDDYDFIINDCAKSFIAGYNEKSKGPKVMSTVEDAKYKFLITVENVDRFFDPMEFVPGFKAKVWADVKLIEVDSEDIVAEILIDEADEGRDFVANECFGKNFYEIGKKMAKMK